MSHSFALQITTQLQASAFQLAEQGGNYGLEGNCLNVCSIHKAVSWLITLRITGINLLSLSLILTFKNTGDRIHSFKRYSLLWICKFPSFPGWGDTGVYLGKGCVLLEANDLFTACVWNLLWLVDAVTCPPTERILFIFVEFHRRDESNKGWDCHQTSAKTPALQETCQFAAAVILSFVLVEVSYSVTFSHKLQNKQITFFAQIFWCALKIKKNIIRNLTVVF